MRKSDRDQTEENLRTSKRPKERRARTIRHRDRQKKQSHIAEVIFSAEDPLPRTGMPAHQIAAILRQNKCKQNTRHNCSRAQNQKQLVHLIQRVSRHNVEDEQNAAQQHGIGADRSCSLLRHRTKKQRENRKKYDQLHLPAQPKNRMMPPNDEDHAATKNQHIVQAIPKRRATRRYRSHRRCSIHKRRDAVQSEVEQRQQQTPRRGATPQAAFFCRALRRCSPMIADRDRSQCLKRSQTDS